MGSASSKQCIDLYLPHIHPIHFVSETTFPPIHRISFLFILKAFLVLRQQNLMHYGRLAYCLGLNPACGTLDKIHQFHHLKNGRRFYGNHDSASMEITLCSAWHKVSLQSRFAITTVIIWNIYFNYLRLFSRNFSLFSFLLLFIRLPVFVSLIFILNWNGWGLIQ